MTAAWSAVEEATSADPPNTAAIKEAISQARPFKELKGHVAGAESLLAVLERAERRAAAEELKPQAALATEQRDSEAHTHIQTQERAAIDDTRQLAGNNFEWDAVQQSEAQAPAEHAESVQHAASPEGPAAESTQGHESAGAVSQAAAPDQAQLQQTQTQHRQTPDLLGSSFHQPLIEDNRGFNEASASGQQAAPAHYEHMSPKRTVEQGELQGDQAASPAGAEADPGSSQHSGSLDENSWWLSPPRKPGE